MPLRARIGDREVVSMDLDSDTWIALKEDIAKNQLKIVLSCCQQEGSLRKSSKGFYYFTHKQENQNCPYQSETSKHTQAKIDIINACRANGWTAIPEYAENDWRADIFATKNDQRLAFEIQWNAATPEENQKRQMQFSSANVRTCWFYRVVPKELRDHRGAQPKASKEIPAFKIVQDDQGGISVTHAQMIKPIGQFVSDLLLRRLKFCANYKALPKQEIDIIFFRYHCWKCKAEQYLYTVNQPLHSCCGTEMLHMGEMWTGGDLDLNPSVVAAVKEFTNSPEGGHIKIGEIKNRYSNTVQQSYPSFGCYYCDSIFGDFYLMTEKMDAQYMPDKLVVKKAIDFGHVTHEGDHWCFSKAGNFCE